MVDAFVSFGIEKLWDLLSRESARLNGIDEQVDGLKEQLQSLQLLLKDADAKKHESDTVRNFLEDVKDLVYDAEDIIESFILKEFRGKQKGIKKHAKRLACFLVDRRKFASDIESITKRISKVIGRMQSLGIQIFDGGRSLSLQDRQRQQRDFRREFPKSSANDLVGVEQSVEELVGHLVKNDNIQVVSISGMGGIGKTTLARQVFHHDDVRRYFDGFAWVSVSQEFTQKHVWQKILQNLRPQDGSIEHMDECTLQGKIFELLQTGRHLVVIDDIWKEKDWDQIKAVFPQEKGWKMLLTSRNEGVGLHADPTCFAFRSRTLTLEESWTLFERIAFPTRDESEFMVDEGMETLGKKMVMNCGGLPLAVELLGGLLAKKHTVREWGRVYDNIGTKILGKNSSDDINPNSVDRILSLSYEDLPMQLKHCFLYLAHFPEDDKIDVKTLFNYWAAEGMIFYDGSTIEDSGEDNLEELVRRNMVIAGRSDLTSKFEYCQMHDMMREVCLSKAKEENFVRIVEVPVNAQSSCRSRRLVVVHGGNGPLKPSDILGSKNCKARSVLIYGDKRNILEASITLSFRSLPFLRVLNLDWINFKGWKLPSSIGELIHLRFLNVVDSFGNLRIPSSLRNLKRLLYLGLHLMLAHIPNVLKEMQELRYLFLPWCMDDKTKLELGDLVNLEALENFSTEHSSVRDLLSMTKLRCLSMRFSGCRDALTSSLCELRNLEMLTLVDFTDNHGADQDGEIVLDFIRLKELILFMHMPRFPDRFPSRLAIIRLGYCGMKEDPMSVLEKLLHLKSVEFSGGVFVGRKMVCSKDGFPQLSTLILSQENELEEWIVEEGSMPLLHTLSIYACEKLKELPDGIKDITSLKELRIDMKREWTAKLEPGGDDYYKVKHIPTVQFTCSLVPMARLELWYSVRSIRLL